MNAVGAPTPFFANAVTPLNPVARQPVGEEDSDLKESAFESGEETSETAQTRNRPDDEERAVEGAPVRDRQQQDDEGRAREGDPLGAGVVAEPHAGHARPQQDLAHVVRVAGPGPQPSGDEGAVVLGSCTEGRLLAIGHHLDSEAQGPESGSRTESQGRDLFHAHDREGRQRRPEHP